MFLRWGHKPFLFVAGALLCLYGGIAEGQSPSVTNLSLVQNVSGPGTADIQYDLASPKGPCRVQALLSKDGGVTFPFRVTTATGDIGPGVVPGSDKRIVWNLMVDCPREDIEAAVVRLIVDDDHPAMIRIPAGTFTMGRRDDGDDAPAPAGYGQADELPRHEVTLDAFEIARHETTNEDFAFVLNWALGQGYLADQEGLPYTGGDVYAYGRPLVRCSFTGSQVQFSGGQFYVLARNGHSLAPHPVVWITWYGAATFCNWVSEMEGRTPCYDTASWTIPYPFPDGYRLPSEAEWERAAAWDSEAAEGHCIYGVWSDSLDISRANIAVDWGILVNPIRFSSRPFTTPVAYYDGVHTFTYGGVPVQTVYSASPSGLVDAAGNATEWVHDRYSFTFYATSPPENPLGPATGSDRVLRGGSWLQPKSFHRTARRLHSIADTWAADFGFRLARTPGSSPLDGSGGASDGSPVAPEVTHHD